MKRAMITLAILGCDSLRVAKAQQINPPLIEWQQSFGGHSSDALSCLRQTADGGFLLSGASSSETNAIKTSPNWGFADFWAVRIDSHGNRLWDRSYGGNEDDVVLGCCPTSDGGCLLVGDSMSPPSGNKTSPFFGGDFAHRGDYWIVRLDSSGNKLWETSFGGTGGDEPYAVQQTTNGGFIVGGRSASGTNGNKTTALFGVVDFWVVCVDTNGSELWQKSYGGSGAQELASLIKMPDGGFLLGGWSNSGPDGNKTSPLFSYAGDYWIVRIDSDGNVLWDRSFGGTGAPNRLRSAALAPDGGLILAGHSAALPGGNKTSPFYGGSLGDFWVVRTDANGNKLWDKSFGGTGEDIATVVKSCPDGGFVVGGYSTSPPSGNKTSPFYGIPINSASDFWLIRLDADGNKLWEQSYGGTDQQSLSDVMYDLELTADGGYILGGESSSGVSGNKTSPNYGSLDFWVIKLGPEPPTLRVQSQSNNDILTNGFRFFLNGISNYYVTEISTDLVNWSMLGTNHVAATGIEIEVVDWGSTNVSGRFYRARRMP